MNIFEFRRQEEFLIKFFLDYYNQHLDNLKDCIYSTVYSNASYKLYFENHVFVYTLTRDINTSYKFSVHEEINNSVGEEIISKKLEINELKEDPHDTYQTFITMKKRGEGVEKYYKILSRKEKLKTLK